jgi:preprotein translocase SecE subunit
MATAVQPTTTAPDPKTKLAVASVVGGALVLGGVVVAAYVVPMLWKSSVTPALGKAIGGPADAAFRLLAQLGAIAGFVYAGSALAGPTPPRGVRGGIGLVVSLVIAIFFVVRAVGLNLEETAVGLPVTLVALAGLLFCSFKLLTSETGHGYMTTLEDQGWFGTFNFKKTQGLKLRRYTMIGLLILAWSGAWAMYSSTLLGTGDLLLRIPFTDPPRSVAVLTDVNYTAPFLLAAGTFWLAWRAVNVPTFADFLIATEAEMNKVSWSTRKRLMQDTVVVLVTTVLLTGFLMAVDVFWGWLLSREVVGVLPTRDPAAATVQAKGAEW